MRMPKIMQSWMLAVFVVAAMASSILMSSVQAAEDKPFAEQKVVLQISDNDPTKQTLVLNVAANLIKFYGPDMVDVEIVAFGPGLRLLFADNVNAERINGLDTSGVRFAACSNTLAKVTKKLGHAPEMNTHAVHVDAGVVRILDLTGQGYQLIKP